MSTVSELRLTIWPGPTSLLIWPNVNFSWGAVTYLGKVVGYGQVREVITKVLATDQFPPSTTRKELMHFLGMVGYYRGFWRNFSTVVTPLTNLLSSKVKVEWSTQYQCSHFFCSCLGSFPSG